MSHLDDDTRRELELANEHLRWLERRSVVYIGGGLIVLIVIILLLVWIF